MHDKYKRANSTNGKQSTKSKRADGTNSFDSSNDFLLDDVHIRYNTLPFSSENIDSGRTYLTEPHDKVASAHGWIDGRFLFVETNGNNVNVTLNAANIEIFGDTFDFDLQTSDSAAQAGGVVAFTATNFYHDL